MYIICAQIYASAKESVFEIKQDPDPENGIPGLQTRNWAREMAQLLHVRLINTNIRINNCFQKFYYIKMWS